MFIHPKHVQKYQFSNVFASKEEYVYKFLEGF